MENSAGLSPQGVRQPVWASKFLWDHFPEVAKWTEELERIVIQGIYEDQKASGFNIEDLRSRAVAYFQAVDQIQREELPVSHLSCLRDLVSSLL